MPSASALPSAPSEAAQRSDAPHPRYTPAGQAPRGRGPRAYSAVLGSGGDRHDVFLTVAGAAGEPSQYVPGRSGGWPGWLAGPLEGWA